MGRRGHRPGDGWVEPAPPAPKRKHDNTKHRALCLLAAKWLRNKDALCCPWVTVEQVTTNPENPDVFGWNYWATTLIEVKVSRSDFLADAKKPFRQNLADGLGAFRYYCCPAEMITSNEVPADWGLLWVIDSGIVVKIKDAQRQPSNGQAEIAIITSIMRREGIKPKVFDYRQKQE